MQTPVVGRTHSFTSGQFNFRSAGETFFPRLEETFNLADQFQKFFWVLFDRSPFAQFDPSLSALCLLLQRCFWFGENRFYLPRISHGTP